MNVLCLRNNFTGGYHAFKTFYDEILDGFEKLGVNVFVADSVTEAMKFYETESIDFSLNIGKYFFFLNDIPLYDVFKIVNYEWIIDNPLKYNADTKSIYNRLIMIDSEFLSIDGFYRSDYMVLPLGGPHFEYNEVKRKNAVLVPWRIKSLSDLTIKIEESPFPNEILDFIHNYDYDSSYISFFNQYLNECKSIKDRVLFFRLTNDYIRADKRIRMVNAIHDYPVVIVTDEHCKEIIGDNVSYLPTGDFLTTLDLQRQYRYVLNSNPNYYMSLHERVTHAIANGAVVVTDENALLTDINFPLRIKQSNLGALDELIHYADQNFVQLLNKQRNCVFEYRMENTLKKIIMNCHELQV